MMIELPALAPFDPDDEDLGLVLSPASMLGQPDEIYDGGVPGWKQNPSELGAGLLAFVRAMKPLADETPKIAGDVFLERLKAQGVDTSEVSIVPAAILHDASIGDEAANGE